MKFENIDLKTQIIRVYGSQERFAEVLGLSPVTVSNKLNGKSNLKLDEIANWAKLLQIPTEQIGQYFFCKQS